MRDKQGTQWLNTIAHMDIFDLCDCVEENSVDMILCDLPYGITACEWDSVIPIEPMWVAFKRIIKPRGAIVLTASQPFTSQLVMSNLEWFKEEIIWSKDSASNFICAKYMHLKTHESILVFGDGRPCFNPQMSKVGYFTNTAGKNAGMFGGIYGKMRRLPNNNRESKMHYPTTIKKSIKPKHNSGEYCGHPTQKPVALFEYLIRTYTQPGELVFDPCVGSGTTAMAARNTGRDYIVGDSSEEYVQVARERLAQPYTMPMFKEQVAEPVAEQAALW